MARRLTERGTQRRKELLDVASRMFAADGYHTTSVTAIVDRIGVGKGVFYWYFDSKDALMRQVLLDAQQGMRQAQREAIAGEHDPVRRIEQGIRASIEWLSDHRHLFALLEFARTEERFAPIVRAGEEQAVADALPHVAAGVTAGLLRREDPTVLAIAVLGVSAHLARSLMLERGADANRVAEAAIAFCRSGFLTPKG
ncbi:MAG: TetR/AcrR family transcriptional regulator [Acidimicrobiales bacterium]